MRRGARRNRQQSSLRARHARKKYGQVGDLRTRKARRVFRNPTTQVQREDCDRQHVHYIRNRVMRHPPKNTQPK